MDRYERRARSRRKSAIRAFDEARAEHSAFGTTKPNSLVLGSRTSAAGARKQLDKLAREIAIENAISNERALQIAQAEFELARVRRAKIAVIERVRAFGELDPPEAFRTVTQIKRFFNAFDRGILILPKPSDSLATMPSQGPERLAEAVRRVLLNCVNWTATSGAL